MTPWSQLTEEQLEAEFRDAIARRDEHKFLAVASERSKRAAPLKNQIEWTPEMLERLRRTMDLAGRGPSPGVSLRRTVTVIACFAASAIGIFHPLIMLAVATRAPQDAHAPFIVASSVVMIYAWIVLAVMSIGWIQDRRVSRFWPLSGTIAGVLSVIAALVIPAIWVLPAIALACWVSVFHLRSPGRIRMVDH